MTWEGVGKVVRAHGRLVAVILEDCLKGSLGIREPLREKLCDLVFFSEPAFKSYLTSKSLSILPSSKSWLTVHAIVYWNQYVGCSCRCGTSLQLLSLTTNIWIAPQRRQTATELTSHSTTCCSGLLLNTKDAVICGCQQHLRVFVVKREIRVAYLKAPI